MASAEPRTSQSAAPPNSASNGRRREASTLDIDASSGGRAAAAARGGAAAPPPPGSKGYHTLPCRAWILEPQPEVGASRRDARSGRLGEPSLPLIPPRDPPIRFRKSVPDCWIGLELIEGKNRQVRRMTAAIGHPTLRLIRVRIGNFLLGDLPAGQWRILTEKEGKFILEVVKRK